MPILDKLLEKWHLCHENRYSVLLIITAPMDTMFPKSLIEQFAEIAGAQILDFKEIYKGKLGNFFSWQRIRDEIYKASESQSTVVVELEPIYAKWPAEERLSFLKNLLRSEPAQGVLLIMNCQDDLSEIKSIDENSRGMIWAPLA